MLVRARKNSKRRKAWPKPPLLSRILRKTKLPAASSISIHQQVLCVSDSLHGGSASEDVRRFPIVSALTLCVAVGRNIALHDHRTRETRSKTAPTVQTFSNTAPQRVSAKQCQADPSAVKHISDTAPRLRFVLCNKVVAPVAGSFLRDATLWSGVLVRFFQEQHLPCSNTWPPQNISPRKSAQ